MIEAKNIKTKEVLSFTDRDFELIQKHFPGEWEKVKEFNGVIPAEDDDLQIEIVSKNNQIKKEETEISTKDYPKGWALKKEFIDEKGNVYHKGKLVK